MKGLIYGKAVSESPLSLAPCPGHVFFRLCGWRWGVHRGVQYTFTSGLSTLVTTLGDGWRCSLIDRVSVETGSHGVSQTDFKLGILLPQRPRCCQLPWFLELEDAFYD